MRILLTEGSSLTARQCSTLLSRRGHTVEALSSDPLCLCRFTRHVRRVRRSPHFAADPFRWLEEAVQAYRDGGFDLLFPTQEQVAVLAAAQRDLAESGVVTVVPPFEALMHVQDKISAANLLVRLGLPQPRWRPVTTGDDVGPADRFPAFLKVAVGTATLGVRRLADASALPAAARELGIGETTRVLLLQSAVPGPLVMVQSVFADGELVAFHAVRREREGASGGASHKRGIPLGDVEAGLRLIGQHLRWHGALSADVILGPEEPVFIDLNPRIVEPVNAYLSGVDLVGALVDVARGTAPPRTVAEPGVATHQLLIALLGAAQYGGRRRVVARELTRAATRRGAYRGSVEELTPAAGDLRAAIPVAGAAVAVLARPSAWRMFTTGAVGRYALTPLAWQRIIDTWAQRRRTR